jgi:dimethylglycine dehydrogenase
MTVTRISENEFFCVTASVGKKHDQHWLLENLPSDNSVLMDDLTYKMGCLVLVGPDSRKVLEKSCHGDVSNEALKFSTSKEIYVGRTKCRINRMNYVGELGFEIFHPIEQQVAVYNALTEAGKDFDIKFIGMHAMNSMRLEKGYLAWKSEMNVHHTPLETNVAWTVKLDKKDFIGKKGIIRQKEQGIDLKLVCLVVEATDSDPWGYNPILKDGEKIGMTSSGGYGHRVEKSIALGYVKSEFSTAGTDMDVEILGRERKAKVVTMPLYDPENKKMKS